MKRGFEEMTLNFNIALIKSQYLEKKIKGIVGISEFVSRVEKFGQEEEKQP